MSAPEINLVVARPENGMLKLTVVVDGQPKTLVAARHVAATAVSQITEALAAKERT